MGWKEHGHNIIITNVIIKPKCLKLMVAQSPLVTQNWAGSVKFDPGQVKIMIIQGGKFSEHFWATK